MSVRVRKFKVGDRVTWVDGTGHETGHVVDIMRDGGEGHRLFLRDRRGWKRWWPAALVEHAPVNEVTS